jgi:hypothetical protein
MDNIYNYLFMKTPKKKYKKKMKLKTTRKKLYCNPHARKNKIAKNSCFTPKAIDLLKNFYNQQNPNKKIQSNSSKTILNTLQTITQDTCTNDICLIKSFTTNKRDESMLKSLLFPPPQPAHWDDEPDSWLSNFDIMDVLNQYENTHPQFRFIGPSSIDYDTKIEISPNKSRCVCKKLCEFQLNDHIQYSKNKTKQPVEKIGIIFNMDPHDKRGSHWVSMFIDITENFIFYFDSNGNAIPKQIQKFSQTVMDQGKNMTPPKYFELHQNTKTEHQMKNTECGMYCLYFIITMLLREKEISYNKEGGGTRDKMTKKELFHLFKNTRIPDEFVFGKRDEYFLKSL